MWLILAVLSLLTFASTDILGKKNVDSGGVSTPMEMIVSIGILYVIVGGIMYGLGAGSGISPWEVLLKHPLIPLSLIFYIMYLLLCLYSLRYVGLTTQEAFNNTISIFYFAGLIIVNLLTGKLSSALDMLHPLRLLPIILILVFTALLTNTKASDTRHRMIAGMSILFLAVLFDAAALIASTVIFDEGCVSTADYLIAINFAAIFPVCIISVCLRAKNKKWYIPFTDGNIFSNLYPATLLTSTVLYICAASFDAVRTGIIFIAYPIIPMIGAKLLLKERYSWKQNLCIWGTAVASIVFCIADYIVD